MTQNLAMVNSQIP